MSRGYQVRKRAKLDLAQIVEVIAAGNSQAALNFLDAAVISFQFLSEFPGAGPRRSSNRKSLEKLRFWPIHGFENYLVFYLPRRNRIEIVRVLHGAQDLTRVFG